MKLLFLTILLPFVVSGLKSQFNFTNIDFDDNITLQLDLPNYNNSIVTVKEISYNINVTSECQNIFMIKQLDFEKFCIDHCSGVIARNNHLADPFLIKIFGPENPLPGNLNATFVVKYSVCLQ